MDVSPNSAAEMKYRNIKPWLLRCIGRTEDFKNLQRRQVTSRPTSTLQRFSKHPVHQVTFNSIPAVCSLPHSQHIVTSEFATPNYPTCRVQIIDKKGTLLHSFETEVERRSTSTFGVAPACEDDSSIAICIGSGVGIWTVEGKLTSTMKGKDVQNCCHVTKMQNGLLATTCITDMRGRCVTLWDPKSGKIASQFGSRPEVIEKNPLKATQRVLIRNTDIRLPWFLTSNSRDEIFIADRNARCIKMFDARNGSFVKSFDPCGVNTRCKNTLSPQGLCTDENDNLVVVESSKKSLLVFDRHGEFVRALTTRGDGTIQGEPWAISMTTAPQFTRPICRSKGKSDDNARTLIVSMATPEPVVGICKLSLCPHYTDFA